MLINDFHTNGALASDNVHIVIGGYVDQAFRLAKGLGMGGCLVVIIAMQNDFGATVTHRIHFNAWGILTHNNGGSNAKVLGRNGHSLSMIACRCGNHPGRFFRLGKLRHFVVGPAQFEAVYRLHVLTFQADVEAKTPA